MNVFEFDPGPSGMRMSNAAGFTYGVESMERDWNDPAGRAGRTSQLTCDHVGPGTEGRLLGTTGAHASDGPAGAFVGGSGENDLRGRLPADR
jgi:hypothetical protein